MHVPPRGDFRHKPNMFQRLEKRIVEKPWGRCDLDPAFGEFGNRRVGEIWFAPPSGDLASPMVKFLFTSERLSIQVHPDDEAARASGQRCGKDECWLVLAADENAKIGVGLKASTDGAALHCAALDGSIVDLVDWRAASEGDFIYNAAGTIHAIGAGLTLVEVQQNVDTTYRLFDYGRPRELHLEEGLAVARTDTAADARNCGVHPAATAKLVSGPHFHLFHLAGPVDPSLFDDTSGPLTLVPLSTGCRVAGSDIEMGEAVMFDDAALIEIDSGGRALLCWPA